MYIQHMQTEILMIMTNMVVRTSVQLRWRWMLSRLGSRSRWRRRR